MENIRVSVARIQADLSYGERVKVYIDDIEYGGIIASVSSKYITVRLDNNRMICDYPLRHLEYFDPKKERE